MINTTAIEPGLCDHLLRGFVRHHRRYSGADVRDASIRGATDDLVQLAHLSGVQVHQARNLDRLGLFYEAADQAFGVAVQVASRMGRILGWNPRTIEDEIAAYAELVRTHRAFRKDHGG